MERKTGFRDFRCTTNAGYIISLHFEVSALTSTYYSDDELRNPLQTANGLGAGVYKYINFIQHIVPCCLRLECYSGYGIIVRQ
jgi:hypothetical protein